MQIAEFPEETTEAMRSSALENTSVLAAGAGVRWEM